MSSPYTAAQAAIVADEIVEALGQVTPRERSATIAKILMGEPPEEQRTITRSHYLQLLGLLQLAAQYNQALQSIHTAIAAMLGIDQDSSQAGHISDAIYSDLDADQLLDRLSITKEPSPCTPQLSAPTHPDN